MKRGVAHRDCSAAYRWYVCPFAAFSAGWGERKDKLEELLLRHALDFRNRCSTRAGRFGGHDDSRSHSGIFERVEGVGEAGKVGISRGWKLPPDCTITLRPGRRAPVTLDLFLRCGRNPTEVESRFVLLMANFILRCPKVTGGTSG